MMAAGMCTSRRNQTLTGLVKLAWVPLSLLAAACASAAMPEQFRTWVSPGTTAVFQHEPAGHHGNEGALHTVSQGPNTAVWLKRVDAVSGVTYRVTAWARTRSASAAYVSGRFRLDDGTLAENNPPQEVMSGTSDWRQIGASLTAPDGAVALEIHLTLAGAGEGWFEAIEVADNRAELETKARPAGAGTGTSTQTSPSSSTSRAASAEPEESSAPVAVGWANAMQRIFLRDVPAAVDYRGSGRLEAFQGELAAIQLVIAPRTVDLDGVEVRAGDLAGTAGTIPASAVELHPVGSVRFTTPPQREAVGAEAGYRGWWPDPLLDDGAFAVKRGTRQAVWVAVHVPRGSHAGAYEGAITIRCANAPTMQAKLQLEVWDFALPESWHFRNLLSWHEAWASGLYGTRWNASLEQKYFDFLLDRRINVASMYGDEPYATPERLIAFAHRGQNVLVPAVLQPEAELRDGAEAALTARLDRTVPALREAGVLDRAVVYGWDERGPQWYDEIRAGATLLGNRFPGLKLLAAGVDESYGLASSLGGLDNLIYCPLMKRYDRERAERARARGNRVWWYAVRWPIEDPLIRSRLIPWMTLKAQADGFLVWCLNRWAKNDHPVGSGIETTWNAELDGVEPHSSAMLVYPGESGPLSSLRFENLRLGIQDYDLLKAAEERLRELESTHGDAKRIEALRRAIALPDELVADATHYTFEPERVSEWRRGLARALVSSAAH